MPSERPHHDETHPDARAPRWPRIRTKLTGLLAAAALLPTLAQAGLGSGCKFSFGTPFSGAIAADVIPRIDYVTQWAGFNGKYNLSGMLRSCSPGGRFEGKTPVIYSYIIAFTLRNEFGLLDCNVGTPNLCESGAARLREAQVKNSILAVYEDYAKGTATDWGTQRPVVWLMEPDFYQYAQPGSQSGNPLSFSEAANLMHELMNKVKTHLPNAVFSLDISPWTTDQGQTQAYYKSFNLDRFTYLHTSGGQARAEGGVGSAKISNNQMTYREIFQLTGKPIIADCGYGVGGQAEGHVDAWDHVQNLNNRMQDGVIAISQANPKTAWGSTLQSIYTQLDTPDLCPVALRPEDLRRGAGARHPTDAPALLSSPAALRLEAATAPGERRSLTLIPSGRRLE